LRHKEQALPPVFLSEVRCQALGMPPRFRAG
jgi:hypothetical protein